MRPRGDLSSAARDLAIARAVVDVFSGVTDDQLRRIIAEVDASLGGEASQPEDAPAVSVEWRTKSRSSRQPIRGRCGTRSRAPSDPVRDLLDAGERARMHPSSPFSKAARTEPPSDLDPVSYWNGVRTGEQVGEAREQQRAAGVIRALLPWLDLRTDPTPTRHAPTNRLPCRRRRGGREGGGVMVDSDFARAMGLARAGEKAADMERAKCAAEHITRARCREWIVVAAIAALNESRSQPLGFRAVAEAIADRLLAADQAETGEKP